MAYIKQIRKVFLIMIPFIVALLLILLAFQSVIVIQPSTSRAINEAGLQRTRCQLIVKDALVLKYRTSSSERAQAVNELQTLLPNFEREQAAIAMYPMLQVQVLSTASRADYNAMDVAANTILSNHDKNIDPTQVDIIIAHNNTYLTTINQIVTTLQQLTEDQEQQLFYIESGIDALILVLVLILAYNIRGVTNKVQDEISRLEQAIKNKSD